MNVSAHKNVVKFMNMANGVSSVIHVVKKHVDVIDVVGSNVFDGECIFELNFNVYVLFHFSLHQRGILDT